MKTIEEIAIESELFVVLNGDCTVEDLERFLARIDAERGKEAAARIRYHDKGGVQHFNEGDCYVEWSALVVAQDGAGLFLSPTIPEGMALVPVEPTQEMRLVGQERLPASIPGRSAYAADVTAPCSPPPKENAMLTDDRECETCKGIETIDMRLGGEWNSNPKSKCPDCDGSGRIATRPIEAEALQSPSPLDILDCLTDRPVVSGPAIPSRSVKPEALQAQEPKGDAIGEFLAAQKPLEPEFATVMQQCLDEMLSEAPDVAPQPPAPCQKCDELHCELVVQKGMLKIARAERDELQAKVAAIAAQKGGA